MIVGVLLAAGASRRLGRPKQMLSFGGRSLLAHVLAEVEAAASLDRVVVVIGDEPLAITPASDRSVVVRNEDPSHGCSSSLRTALGHVGDADAVVMLLGDMPGVTSHTIDTIVGRYRRSPTWAAVTEYRDALGHPLLFSAAAFDELRALHGDKAVWKIVDREPEERVARIPIDAPLPRDIDTWHDYEAVHAAFGFDAGERTRRN